MGRNGAAFVAVLAVGCHRPSATAAQQVPTIEYHCPDFSACLKATMALEFPGYGFTDFGQLHADDGRAVIAESIEIPRADADRYFVYLSDQTGLRLVDDVVLATKPYVGNVAVRGGFVEYASKEGQVLARRPLRSP